MKHSKQSAFALGAGLLLIPALGAQQATAQTKGDADKPTTKRSFVLPHVLEKSGYKISIVGVEDGHTIYKDDNDKYFYLDPKTGDQKFVSADYWIKMSSSNKAARFTMKYHGTYRLLGVDADGNSVVESDNGQKFYLDPATGDKHIVK